MIYSVLLDGIGIYESDNNVVLIEPSLSLELNAAGNFEFTMPPWHDYYDHIKPLKSFIEVKEAANSIFYGRVSPHIEIDWNNNKKVYCEGLLSFFGDSIQRPYSSESITLSEFFESIIAKHNSQVDSDVRFSVGYFTMDDISITASTNYETSLECLETLIDTYGGYFLCRHENDTNYIDWYKTIPNTSNQPVQFGMNLLDLSQILEDTNFGTVFVPLGAEDENGVRIDVTSVTDDGRDYLELQDAVNIYGRITKVLEFDNITDPAELLAVAIRYINAIDYGFTIECDAAELHHLNSEYSQFVIGQMVHVLSSPHLIDDLFPIVKMEIELDQAGKRITVGTLPKRDLTEMIRG